jgi:hypothetical protein
MIAGAIIIAANDAATPADKTASTGRLQLSLSVKGIKSLLSEGDQCE